MKYMIVFLSLLIVVVVAAILFVQAELDEMTFGILVRLTIVSFTLFINVKRTLLFFFRKRARAASITTTTCSTPTR